MAEVGGIPPLGRPQPTPPSKNEIVDAKTPEGKIKVINALPVISLKESRDILNQLDKDPSKVRIPDQHTIRDRYLKMKMNEFIENINKRFN